MRSLLLALALVAVMLVTCATQPAGSPDTPSRLARAAIEGAAIVAIIAASQGKHP